MLRMIDDRFTDYLLDDEKGRNAIARVLRNPAERNVASERDLTAQMRA